MKKIQEIEINVQTNVIKWKILILEKRTIQVGVLMIEKYYIQVLILD